MKRIDIYTDGACSGNPGPGGYALVVIKDANIILKLYGYNEYTTNNYMELKAITRAVRHAVNEYCNKHSLFEIYIHSDSAYCINPIEKGWLNFWASNDWKNNKGEEIKNSELWKELYEIFNDSFVKNHFKFHFIKVKGHSGDKYNEMVDKAAKNAILRLNEKKTLPNRRTSK